MKLQGLLLTVSILLVGCGNLSVKLPAVTDSNNTPSLPGKVIWHDLITGKPEESIRFYSGLFGWEFEKLSIRRGLFKALDYYIISLNNEVIGGMVDQNDLRVDVNLSQWVVVLSTDNLDAAVAKAREEGGAVIAEPVDLKARGRIAVVEDKQGALFALLQTKTGDPTDKPVISSGDFLWNELWTSDAKAAATFYQAMLPYTVVEHEVKNTERSYRVLSAQGEPRVGVMPMPVKDLAPTWVAYLRVADSQSLDAMLAKVATLGGSVLLPAQDRLVGGRAALIAGPSGEGIALQTWSFETEKEGN